MIRWGMRETLKTFSSSKIFSCVPITQGRANHSKNVKPDSYLQTSTHRRQTWAKDELLVQGNTPIFRKTHWFGERMQLRNKLLSNEDSNCYPGHRSRRPPGWLDYGYKNSQGWTWTQRLLRKELESPRACSMEEKQDSKNNRKGKRKKDPLHPTITTELLDRQTDLTHK